MSGSVFIQNGSSTPGHGLPLARPLGYQTSRASAQVSGSSPKSRGTNTTGSLVPVLVASGAGAVSPRPPRRPVGARMLDRLRSDLSTRDLDVVRRVAEHRYLTSRQIAAFVFTDHISSDSAARTTRRVLARLERLGLLRRVERRIGGVRAGSSATVWQITSAGARLLRSGNQGSGHRTHEPSLRFLGHCLAVADTHLAILRARGNDGTGIQAITVQTEPACHRRFAGLGGERRWLQSDLAARLTSDDFVDAWFIEVDCGSESLPTILRKCEVYEAYRRTGVEQTEHGVFPLVLWVFDGQPSRAAARATALKRALARSSRFTPGLYRFAVSVPDVTGLVGGQA